MGQGPMVELMYILSASPRLGFFWRSGSPVTYLMARPTPPMAVSRPEAIWATTVSGACMVASSAMVWCGIQLCVAARPVRRSVRLDGWEGFPGAPPGSMGSGGGATVPPGIRFAPCSNGSVP